MSYGVEMARALILKEVQGVFGAYNIDVDIRHLELIADYMVSAIHKILVIPRSNTISRHMMAATSHSIARVSQRIPLLC